MLQDVVDSDGLRKEAMRVGGLPARHLLALLVKERRSLDLKNVALLIEHLRATTLVPAGLAFGGNLLYDDDVPMLSSAYANMYCARYKKALYSVKQLIRINDYEQDLEIQTVFFNITHFTVLTRLSQLLCQEARSWLEFKHPHVLPFFGLDDAPFPEYKSLISPWMKNLNILRFIQTVGLAGTNVSRLVS